MKIQNAKIESVSLTMADHGVLTFYLGLDGGGWGARFGGYVIGKGYLGAEDFSASESGLEAIMRIMDTVGVERWEELTGKYVRVADCEWGKKITRIGNILNDKWFDIAEYFEKAQKEDSTHEHDL